MSTHHHTARSADHVADEWLVQRCQDGSGFAMEALIKRWQEPLWRYAVRLTREPALADDVLQESLLAIVRRIRSLDDPARFRAWAFRIVSNKAADQIRRRQRHRKVESEAGDRAAEPETPPSMDTPVDRVRAAMRRLNPKDRAMLSLFYLDEMGVSEVADLLGIPPGTVKSRLYHARAKLKSILEKNLNPNHQNDD